MIITAIEEQKKHKDRVNIYVDGNFYCGMSLMTCTKYHLAPNLEIDEERLKFLTIELEREKATEKALLHLSKRQKTKNEMIKFLQSKGFEDEIIEYTIGKLSEYSYIDDEKYVRDYIKCYMNKEGRKKIEYELKLKGIDENTIIKELDDTDFDDEIIDKIAQKYTKNKPLDIKTKQNLYRHLCSKGFDSESIMSAINKIFR